MDDMNELLGVKPRQLNYASNLSRFVAYTIDVLLLIVPFLFFVYIFAGHSGIMSSKHPNYDTFKFFSRAIFALILVIYGFFMERTKGATLGKIIAGIVVVDVNGKPINPSIALSRNIIKLFSLVFMGIGFIRVLYDKNKQTWHDKAVKTYVVNKRQIFK